MKSSSVRWNARVEDRLHLVELKRGADGVLSASVDGRLYRLSLSEPQPRVYSMLDEQGRSVEALVAVKPGHCRVRVGEAVFAVYPAEQEGTSGLGAKSSGRDELRSVMPGRVLRVLVSPGDKVIARQGLVVLEAMKMENELAAPRDGTVREVRVAPGRTVEAGETLVVLES